MSNDAAQQTHFHFPT